MSFFAIGRVMVGELPISGSTFSAKNKTKRVMTPETISRKFGELENEGLIQQLSGKRIKILDLDDLLLYSE